MTHSYVQMPRWHVTRLSHMRHKSHSPVLYVYACVSPFGSGCKGLCKRPESISSVTWLIGMCAMTQIHTCHDSSVCGTRLRLQGAVLQRHKAHVAWHGSFACMPWLMCMCAMTKAARSRFTSPWSISCVTWFFCKCVMPHLHSAMIRLHMCHDSFAYVPWFVCICAMIQAIRSRDTSLETICCVTWSIFMCAMTHFH